MKTPSFWYRTEMQKPGLAETALGLLSPLYAMGRACHKRKGRHEKFSVPIICVGNLNAGGSGKTPTAIALAKTLKHAALAKNIFFVSRGYGGSQKEPLRVDAHTHTAKQVGDEPLLLASYASTIVSQDRAKGLHMAERRGADIAIMDDGLQNPHIEKDLKIVVIDGAMGFGNGRLLPAGPLRETLEEGLAAADAFVLIGNDQRNVKNFLPPGRPLFTASLKASEALPKARYVAFSGIGYPEKFLSFLRSRNADVVEAVSYPDHHRYSVGDTRALMNKAEEKNAMLVTTEKDSLRLAAVEGFAPYILRVNLEWDNEPALIDFIRSRLFPS